MCSTYVSKVTSSMDGDGIRMQFIILASLTLYSELSMLLFSANPISVQAACPILTALGQAEVRRGTLYLTISIAGNPQAFTDLMAPFSRVPDPETVCFFPTVMSQIKHCGW